MRFCFVTEKGVPEETGRFLAEACEKRGIEFLSIEGKTFDFDPARRLEPGDILYRGAISMPSARVEQFLYREGVSTFYQEQDGIYYAGLTQTLIHERAGVPIPKTFYVSTNNRALLTSIVEQVGGFPVVLKVNGRSSGIGVMLADSMPSLVSVLDYALAQGAHPLLCQFIANAIHWRLIVVGEKIVGHYKNQHRMGDFRTDGSRNPADFTTPVPPKVADAGIRSVAAIQLEFGGVDVLEDPQGNAFVLEANFPCYYPQAQVVAGVDVAGAMVDHLVEKAKKLGETK